MITIFYATILLSVRGLKSTLSPKEVENPSLDGSEGPFRLEVEEMTTCPEFSSPAGFNPYAVLDDTWFSFFMWAPRVSSIKTTFLIPTSKEKAWLQHHFKGALEKPINWTKTLFLMKEVESNNTVLFENTGDRGEYNIYTLERVPADTKIEVGKVVWKQTGDNKYIGVMFCDVKMVFVFSRINEVPKQKQIQEEASKIGFHGSNGHSYLYQGGRWMPIPDMDEEEFWNPTPEPELKDEEEYFRKPDDEETDTETMAKEYVARHF